MGCTKSKTAPEEKGNGNSNDDSLEKPKHSMPVWKSESRLIDSPKSSKRQDTGSISLEDSQLHKIDEENERIEPQLLSLPTTSITARSYGSRGSRGSRGGSQSGDIRRKETEVEMMEIEDMKLLNVSEVERMSSQLYKNQESLRILESDEEEFDSDDEEISSKSSTKIIAAEHVGTLVHIGAGNPPRKKENQDVILHSIEYGTNKNMEFLCCLDGHGMHGKLVAELVGKWLHEKTELYLSDAETSGSNAAWETAFSKLFKDCDEALKDHPEIGFRGKMSGATLTLIIVHDGVARVANVGDSRAILIHEGKSLRLTVDHRPDDKLEKVRIEKAGGIVQVSQSVDPKLVTVELPLRVYLTLEKSKSLGFRVQVPGLMLTRSIGDAVSKMAGCSCEPSVSHHNLKQKIGDLYLIIATDGIWDVISDEEAANIATASSESSANKIAVEIRDAALREWNLRHQADNIGILVRRYRQ